MIHHGNTAPALDGGMARRPRLIDHVVGVLWPSMALRRATRLVAQGQANRAFVLLARAARAGNAEAEYRVGRCYLDGSGVPASRIDGVRWIERAATRGHVDAEWSLAALHIDGVAPTCRKRAAPGSYLFSSDAAPEPDFEAAQKWARRAAEH